MTKNTRNHSSDIVLTADNPENIRTVARLSKNILVCGIKGAGKITHTISAFKDNTNLYYIGNPVDHEGKARPESYEKYLSYIKSLKPDIRIINDTSSLQAREDEIVVIIDEIYGRSEQQLTQLRRLYEKKNIHIMQIVGCMKYMRPLIDAIDVIIELHHDGAFIVEKDFGKAICEIFGKQESSSGS